MRSTDLRSLSLLLICTILLNGCVSFKLKEDSEAAAPTADQRETVADTPEPVEPWVAKDPALLAEYRKALAAIRAGELEQAKTMLQPITKNLPGLTGPQVNLGILLLKEKDYPAAEQAFRTALKYQPGHAAALNQLGLTLRYQGRFTEAEQAYQAALQHRPDYPLAHRNLGILYDLYLQQADKALPHYRRSQALLAEPDEELALWIADLERRLKTGKAQ